MDALQNYYKNSLLNHLCSEYKGIWQSCHNDKEKLMELVLQRQSLPHFMTYAYEGIGVTKEYAKEQFSEYINEKKVFYDVDGVNGNYASGMYIDFEDDKQAIITLDTCAILWCKNMEILVPITKCPVFYISNNSNVNISMDGYSSIVIYLFDDSNVTIVDADDSCNVTIFKYSKNAGVEVGKYCLAQIKEFDKELRI